MEWLNNGEKIYEDLNQCNSFNLKNMSKKTVAVVFAQTVHGGRLLVGCYWAITPA